MNRVLLLLLLLLADFVAARAATPIAIRNPSFEEGVTLGEGGFTAGDIPSWEDRVLATAGSGVFNPDIPINFAADGTCVVFLNPAGYINQDLKFANASPVVAQAGMVVSVDLQGRGRAGDTCSLRFDLRSTNSGNSVLAAPVTLNIPPNAAGYSPFTVALTLQSASALGANAGQPLYLYIDNPSAVQVNIDQVAASLTVPPGISNFSASPNLLTAAGASSTLSWTVSDAATLTLNGAPVTGTSTTVTPAATTTYTLVATNPDGSTQAQTTVIVNLAAGLVISEFMAKNVSAVADGDGHFNDWIEITNTTAAAKNIAGYHLTDTRGNLVKWTFPSRVIPAGGSLVVFCSGQAVDNYVDAGGYLHTNFKLADEGEYLGLISPDSATILSEFFPAYPEQFANLSYGTGLTPNRIAQTIIPAAAPLKYKVPTGAIPNWQARTGFDDSSWTSGTMSIGFDVNAGPPTTAYVVPANTAGDQPFGGSLGMDFVVGVPITVTDLGCFDDLSNGIAAGVTITVQIWARNDNGTPAVFNDDTGGAVRTSTTFTNASPGTLVDAQRFKPITPIVLAPGAYTLVAYGYGATERNGNMGITFPPVQTNGGGAITFVGVSRYHPVGGQYPSTVDGGPAARYGAGTFVFQTSPGTTVATNIASAMYTVNASAFIRVPFNVGNPNFTALTLNVGYDDGFTAWLNGTLVASRNAPASPLFNAGATGPAALTESIDLSASAGLLVNGANILAIQGHNLTASDPDFRIDARLSGEGAIATRVYFTTPTPGAPNGTGLVFPQVVISELHIDPADSKTYPLEFIELYNPTSAPVSIAGWSFSKGIAYTFPPGTTIPARSYLVVAENPTVLQQRLGAVALGPWIGSLSNDGETVELDDAQANVIDVVDYGLGFPWPTVGGDDGFSMQLLNEGLDNELGGAWRAAAPTPGAANAGTTLDVPPLIRQVDHTRAVAATTPTAVIPSNTAVLITAKITDPDGVLFAAVEYQIVEPGNYLRLTDAAFSSSWTSVPMKDDGTGGDAVANDAIFTAQIPAAVQVHRRLIRYRIKAVDGVANSVTVPLSTEPCPNFAYFVYDGVPAWTAAVNPGATAATTFSTDDMRKVQPWHLLSRPEDVQNSQYNSAFNNGLFQFEGAFVIEGKVYDHIHYRIRGQGSTYNTGKNKWKVKFNRGQWLEMPDDYGRTHTTIATLNLSGGTAPWAPWDRGIVGLDEVMQYRLSNLAGVPSPRTTYFQFRVIDGAAEQNAASQYDGDFWGLYAAFENQDNRFKDAHNLPDGNIFRMQSGSNHVLGQGAGQPANLTDLNAFTSASTGYNKGTPGNVATLQNEAWFRANVDLPKYYAWRSVVEAVNNTDVRDLENVVYFRDPTDGRWHIEPWDCDLLYEQLDRWGPQGTQATTPYEQIRRALDHPALKTEFQNSARELQDLLLNNDQAWKLIDEYLSIISAESPRIIPAAGPVVPGFVEADRRRWDYWPGSPMQPRSNGTVGNYYKTPYPIASMGLGPPQPFSRVLSSADFTGQVKWVKDFIATDAHGGARLAQYAAEQLDVRTIVATGTTVQIPATPVLTDLSAPNHSINNLVFKTSDFSSPNAQTFAGMQWRIAECRWPGVTGFVAGQPWRYEIEPTWTSAVQPVFNSEITIPVQPLETGVTYRVRVKFLDNAGRWSHWSAPIEFSTTSPDVTAYQQNLVVSELMYKPVGGSDFEFIELRNLSSTVTLDLTPVTISGGVDYAFPAGTSLAPGAFLIIPKNLAAFQSRYGTTLPTVAAWGANDSLNNGGDTLSLNYGENVVIRSFTYLPTAPWPNLSNLTGYSIVLKLPAGTTSAPDHAFGQNWRMNGTLHGSPGAAGDGTEFAGTAGADLDRDGFNALLEYALGTSDADPASGRAALGLTREASGTLLFTFQHTTLANDVSYALEASTAFPTGWAPANAEFVSNELLGAGLLRETYRITPPAGATKFMVRLKVTKP